MATYSILAWKITRTEEPGGYSQLGCGELDMTEHNTHDCQSLTKTLRVPGTVDFDSLEIRVPHFKSNPTWNLSVLKRFKFRLTNIVNIDL